MVDWFVATAVGILTAMAGFWIGRWSGMMLPLPPAETADEEESMERSERKENPGQGNFREEYGRELAAFIHRTSSEEPRERGEQKSDRNVGEQRRDGRGRKHHSKEKRIPLGWAIGSPVSGEVSTFYEGSRKGALIKSDQGKLYAPASGKIIRLYPMGNRMVLRTDFGVELLLQVGGQPDELCGACFRPRIIQNEIVGKGKLLLEYDREGLLAEGADTDVSISVEAAENHRDITVTGKAYVKAGDELLWVREHFPQI